MKLEIAKPVNNGSSITTSSNQINLVNSIGIGPERRTNSKVNRFILFKT